MDNNSKIELDVRVTCFTLVYRSGHSFHFVHCFHASVDDLKAHPTRLIPKIDVTRQHFSTLIWNIVDLKKTPTAISNIFRPIHHYHLMTPLKHHIMSVLHVIHVGRVFEMEYEEDRGVVVTTGNV
jgi:hypothetical protein